MGSSLHTIRLALTMNCYSLLFDQRSARRTSYGDLTIAGEDEAGEGGGLYCPGCCGLIPRTYPIYLVSIYEKQEVLITYLSLNPHGIGTNHNNIAAIKMAKQEPNESYSRSP